MSLYKIKNINKNLLNKISPLEIEEKGEILPIIEIVRKDINDKFSAIEHDSFLFDKINLIIDIVKTKKNIIIFWDPDLDWVFSSILLFKWLSLFWYKTSIHIPQKNEWHWINKTQIDSFSKENIDLIILSDNWTNELEEVQYAKSLWIDIVILDHHLEHVDNKTTLIMNPKSKYESYPFKELVSTSIWYKFITWLSIKLNITISTELINEFIDFIIITTISDKAMIYWENKFYLSYFKNEHTFQNTLIKFLYNKISNENPLEFKKNKLIKLLSILNSSIRLNKTKDLINILLDDDVKNIQKNILFLYKQDEERRQIQDNLKEKIKNSNINLKNDYIFTFSEEYEEGFLWLFATFLSQENNKVTFFAKDLWDKIKWSVRTVNWINLFEIFEKYNIPTFTYKWHVAAFWFEIDKKYISDLRFLLKKEIPLIENSKIQVDYELEFDKIITKNLKPLEEQVWWNWNEEPYFISENVTLNYFNLFWNENKNANLFLKQNNIIVKFVLFNNADKIASIWTKPFSIIYKLKLYINKKTNTYICQPVIKEIII